MLTKRNNGIPAYRRIQGSIRSVIEAGELKPGDVVASERELARLHDVSLMTARHALASLEREGVVERRRGVGVDLCDLGLYDRGVLRALALDPA